MTPAMLAGVVAATHHHVLVGERPIGAEEIDHVLAGMCPAYHHLCGLPASYLHEPVEVKRMERLTQLMKHEVRDVDDVVDRSQADGAEPLPQPPRGRPHGDAFDDPGIKPRASLRVLDANPGSQLGRRRR